MPDQVLGDGEAEARDAASDDGAGVGKLHGKSCGRKAAILARAGGLFCRPFATCAVGESATPSRALPAAMPSRQRSAPRSAALSAPVHPLLPVAQPCAPDWRIGDK
jgi:hypothetical protein